MRDPRRDLVLSLILEWDHLESRIQDHLGLTLDQWMRFRVDGELPEDYEPRQPKVFEPPPVNTRGRPEGRHISDETRRKIRERIASGGTQRGTARELGVSQEAVRVAIRKGEAQG
jgi:hypothetical protein